VLLIREHITDYYIDKKKEKDDFIDGYIAYDIFYGKDLFTIKPLVLQKLTNFIEREDAYNLQSTVIRIY